MASGSASAKRSLASSCRGSTGPGWRPWGWSWSPSRLTFTHRTLLSHRACHCYYATNQNATKPALLLRIASTPGFSDSTKGQWLMKGKAKCSENLLCGSNLISSLIKESRNCFLECGPSLGGILLFLKGSPPRKIGRASCRERV